MKKRDTGWTYATIALASQFMRQVELGKTKLYSPKRVSEAFHRYMRKRGFSINELFFLTSFHDHYTAYNRRNNIELPEWPVTWQKRIDKAISHRRKQRAA